MIRRRKSTRTRRKRKSGRTYPFLASYLGAIIPAHAIGRAANLGLSRHIKKKIMNPNLIGKPLLDRDTRRLLSLAKKRHPRLAVGFIEDPTGSMASIKIAPGPAIDDNLISILDDKPKSRSRGRYRRRPMISIAGRSFPHVTAHELGHVGQMERMRKITRSSKAWTYLHRGNLALIPAGALGSLISTRIASKYPKGSRKRKKYDKLSRRLNLVAAAGGGHYVFTELGATARGFKMMKKLKIPITPGRAGAMGLAALTHLSTVSPSILLAIAYRKLKLGKRKGKR